MELLEGLRVEDTLEACQQGDIQELVIHLVKMVVLHMDK